MATVVPFGFPLKPAKKGYLQNRHPYGSQNMGCLFEAKGTPFCDGFKGKPIEQPPCFGDPPYFDTPPFEAVSKQTRLVAGVKKSEEHQAWWDLFLLRTPSGS